jgi:hypothetical protein
MKGIKQKGGFVRNYFKLGIMLVFAVFISGSYSACGSLGSIRGDNSDQALVEKKFFGIDVRAGEIKDVSENKAGTISYRYSGSLNSGTTLKAVIYDYPEYSRIVISVGNNGDSPITTNYFLDRFSVLTKSGKEYAIKLDISNYSGETLNPGEDQNVSMNLYNSELKTKKIAAVLCQIGGAGAIIKATPYKTIKNTITAKE